MATSTIPVESVISREFTSGIQAYRCGRIVFVSFEGCTVPSAASANQHFSGLSSEYIPRYPVSFIDSINMQRRIVIGTDGLIYCTSALAKDTLVRGFATYIAKN